jgi:predicted transcriptional regulator
MLFHMKQFLVEIDDRCARDLERVAPARERKRAEFVRLALRRAIDLALDRATAEAYLAKPFADDLLPEDLLGWDEHNDLVRPRIAGSKRARRRTRARKRAA